MVVMLVILTVEKSVVSKVGYSALLLVIVMAVNLVVLLVPYLVDCLVVHWVASLVFPLAELSVASMVLCLVVP